ncbi:MAG: lysozyme inhibitor LprI family protein [Terriglobales bacterium]
MGCEGPKASVRAAQRAWLQYRDLHCQAVGAIQVGVGSMEPTEINTCKQT